MGPDVPTGSLIDNLPADGPGSMPAPQIGGSQRASGRGHGASATRGRELVDVLFASVLLALFVRTFLVQAFVVPSASMEDTVLIGDYLLVNKFVFAPHVRGLVRVLPFRDVRRGDVIVFKFPGDPQRDFIKRAIGLPGDLVTIRGRSVFVNGAPEEATRARRAEDRGERPDASPAEGSRQENVSTTRIPDAAYFAMGDNRDNSSDSRSWGPVPAENLKGRALLVYWSLPPPPEGRVGPIRRLGAAFLQTRWSRMFRLVR
jgi:signal peptidase I